MDAMTGFFVKGEDMGKSIAIIVVILAVAVIVLATFTRNTVLAQNKGDESLDKLADLYEKIGSTTEYQGEISQGARALLDKRYIEAYVVSRELLRKHPVNTAGQFICAEAKAKLAPWKYLECKGTLKVKAYDAFFSPDGRFLVVVGDDGISFYAPRLPE